MGSLFQSWTCISKIGSFTDVCGTGSRSYFTVTTTPAQNTVTLLTFVEIIRWVVAAMVTTSLDTIPFENVVFSTAQSMAIASSKQTPVLYVAHLLGQLTAFSLTGASILPCYLRCTCDLPSPQANTWRDCFHPGPCPLGGC